MARDTHHLFKRQAVKAKPRSGSLDRAPAVSDVCGLEKSEIKRYDYVVLVVYAET